MKIEDVVRQLQLSLQNYTDKFHVQIPLVSITPNSPTTVIAETVADHNLQTNNYVSVIDALTPNPIDILTSAGTIASAETFYNHDLTERYQLTIDVVGANFAEYNGSHSLLTVPNRKNFTYNLTSSTTSPDTGSPELLEKLSYGYNGWHQITVIDATHFSYIVPKEIFLAAKGNFKCYSAPRIWGILNLDLAIRSYTKAANENTIYVSLSDEVGNRERSTVTDSTYEYGHSYSYSQYTSQYINVYIFIPAKNYAGARYVRDLAEDFKIPICNSLLGIGFDNGFNLGSEFGVVFAKSGIAENGFQESFYIHEFVFELTGLINQSNVVIPDNSVAFRDIYFEAPLSLQSGKISDTINQFVDLDDEPLN